MHCVLCFMLCASGDILFIPIKCVYFRSFLQVFGLTRRLAWSISMAFSSLWECCFFIAFRATSHCTWAICFSFYYSYVRHNVGISGIFEANGTIMIWQKSVWVMTNDLSFLEFESISMTTDNILKLWNDGQWVHFIKSLYRFLNSVHSFYLRFVFLRSAWLHSNRFL